MVMFSTTAAVTLAALAPLTHAAGTKFTSTEQAGAVFDGVLPYSGLVSGAGATLIVPAVHLPAGADPRKVYSGSAAAGMVGYKCPGAFVSAGVTWEVRNRTVTYSAYLSNGTLFNHSAIKVSQGDRVSLFAEVFGGGGAAQATLENESTGQSQSQYFPVYNYNYGACNRTANWAVLNTVANKQVPFAAFTSVDFTSASYSSFDPLNGWQNRGLTNATAIDLVGASSKVIAAGSIPDGSTVKITYKN